MLDSCCGEADVFAPPETTAPPFTGVVTAALPLGVPLSICPGDVTVALLVSAVDTFAVLFAVSSAGAIAVLVVVTAGEALVFSCFSVDSC